MTFHVGQKVVRVAVSTELHAENLARCIPRRKGMQLAEVGKVYTISTINVWPRSTLLTFEELDNSHLIGSYGTIEPGFDSRAFRPIVERKTSIEVFDKIRRDVERRKVREIA